LKAHDVRRINRLCEEARMKAEAQMHIDLAQYQVRETDKWSTKNSPCGREFGTSRNCATNGAWTLLFGYDEVDLSLTSQFGSIVGLSDFDLRVITLDCIVEGKSRQITARIENRQVVSREALGDAVKMIDSGALGLADGVIVDSEKPSTTPSKEPATAWSEKRDQYLILSIGK
jgi:hypothetical protein